jgi:hypothetical protein
MRAGTEKMSFLRCEQWVGAYAVVRPLLLTMLSVWALQAQPQDAKAQPRRGARKEAVNNRLLSLELKSKAPAILPADAVVQKMMATSARRSEDLRGYRTTRNYRLQYHGFLGTREAGMQVVSTYTAPDKLEFSVISESGSKLLLNRVLLKLLDSERDAFHDQSKIELNPANYQFQSDGIEQLSDNDPCYVLGVQPKKENKFLYRGKVWIDANDFALARMEGQPAKSPSFWIRDTQIDSTWAKVGGFWLIQHSQSVSHVRMGGMATLTIDYSDYQVTRVSGAQGHGQSPQLPDPGSVTPQR